MVHDSLCMGINHENREVVVLASISGLSEYKKNMGVEGRITKGKSEKNCGSVRFIFLR